MARIHRVDPATAPGIRRQRARGRFRYLDADGRPVDEATRRRIADLVIPPAWTHVWISPDPDGHIQAVGTDVAGRRQYLYHERWRTRRDGEKFDRALDLAAALPTARALVTRDLRGDDPRRRTLAAAFRMLDRGAVRIGSPGYLRRYGSRGLLTLRWGDLHLRGATISLRFTGKLGQPQLVEFEDDDLRVWIRAQPARPLRALILRYRAGRRMRSVTPGELNAYIASVTGNAFTAKDLRTLRGTIIAALALADPAEDGGGAEERERRAVDAVAAALGNTRAVARASYVDPRVLRAARAGRVLDRTVSPETALLRLLRAS
ncbi:DNA topoisomerase IB [Microbacterium sp. CIAB417]|uniref:DNA topoisomerase IB n=1 Tax=Microbacterium sp. CIAB417 TaxID=2860287 RepID=UPI001FADD6C6|nr:DNA topoisomerase IB [Microbacterium sp. CIAB417]